MARSWIRSIHQSAHVKPMGTTQTRGTTRVDGRSLPIQDLDAQRAGRQRAHREQVPQPFRQAEVVEGISQVRAVDTQGVGCGTREPGHGLARAQPDPVWSTEVGVAHAAVQKEPQAARILLHDEAPHLLARGNAHGVLDDPPRPQVAHEASAFRHAL